MEQDKLIILEKQKIRYKILYALWKAVDGDHNKRVNFYEITDNEGLSKELANDIYQYLIKKISLRIKRSV